MREFPPRTVLTGTFAATSGVMAIVALAELASSNPGGEAAPIAAISAVLAALLTSHTLACMYFPQNVGRRHSLMHTAARVCGYSVRDCGCTYSSTPPNASEVETETVWVRSEADARVTFRKSERGLKRCHRCGNHFHFTESVGWRATDDNKIACWPEEEPVARDIIDEEIVEAETNA